jgi:hypothetical protein
MGLTGGAAGLAVVSGPATPSLTPVPPTGGPISDRIQAESVLLQYLLHSYNNKVRPVINASSIVTVHVGITLTQIFDMVSLL